MSKQNETGHAINVANFGKLIAYVDTYPEYKPANSKLLVTSLNDLFGNAKKSMSDVNAATSPRIVAINKRQQLFALVSPLATRVIAALSASQIEDRRIVADAQTVARKLQGRRATPKQETDPANPEAESKNISASQKSFDNQVEFTDKLIKILEKEPGYAPNEAELTLPLLGAFHKSLDMANKAVIDAQAAYNNQLIMRQNILYAPVNGLVDIAKEVKNYVKSIYTASHPSFKQVNALRFRKVTDRK